MDQAALREELVEAGRSAVLVHWTETLRAACKTLSRIPAPTMMSISVAGRLKGDLEEGKLLRSLSREIAREYGFNEVVDLEGTSISVRFSRPLLA